MSRFVMSSDPVAGLIFCPLKNCIESVSGEEMLSPEMTAAIQVDMSFTLVFRLFRSVGWMLSTSCMVSRLFGRFAD